MVEWTSQKSTKKWHMTGFTIFKCDYNVGVIIIIYLFDVVQVTMTSDAYIKSHRISSIK